MKHHLKSKKDLPVKTKHNDFVEYLRPLFYFGVFSHPLTTKEIRAFNESSISEIDLKAVLTGYVEDGLLYESDGYYSIHPNIQELNIRRRKLTDLAEKYRNKAISRALFIGKFPFVRAVMISGSFSKGIITEDGDVDYFLITRKNRLWLSRTLLILYKKIVLFNSHRFFCVNYFLDETHLEIEEKNLFTATEGITLMPIVGKKWCSAFQQNNKWINDHFANDSMRSLEVTRTFQKSFMQRIVEFLLKGWIGDKVEDYLRNVTVRYWKSKFKSLPPSRFKIALKSTKYVSKHHPQDFQFKVLNKMDELKSNFISKLES